MKYTGTIIEYVAGYMGMDLKMKMIVLRIDIRETMRKDEMDIESS